MKGGNNLSSVELYQLKNKDSMKSLFCANPIENDIKYSDIYEECLHKDIENEHK